MPADFFPGSSAGGKRKRAAPPAGHNGAEFFGVAPEDEVHVFAVLEEVVGPRGGDGEEAVFVKFPAGEAEFGEARDEGGAGGAGGAQGFGKHLDQEERVGVAVEGADQAGEDAHLEALDIDFDQADRAGGEVGEGVVEADDGYFDGGGRGAAGGGVARGGGGDAVVAEVGGMQREAAGAGGGADGLAVGGDLGRGAVGAEVFGEEIEVVRLGLEGDDASAGADAVAEGEGVEAEIRADVDAGRAGEFHGGEEALDVGFVFAGGVEEVADDVVAQIDAQGPRADAGLHRGVEALEQRQEEPTLADPLEAREGHIRVHRIADGRT